MAFDNETSEAQAEAQARKQMAEMLRKGEKLKVGAGGKIEPANDSTGIEIPPGKLAAFHWYENDLELFNLEKTAMARFYPQFQMGKFPNGKLYWLGSLSPGLFRHNKPWLMQAVYQNNHPNNSSYGGSIRIYALDPDLDEISQKFGYIPHTLRDEAGKIYLCTANMDDVRADSVVTTAASSLGWAVKWISSYELWVNGEMSKEEFGRHGGI
jgi:hypothetical protein